MTSFGHGLFIGKFYPPHLGHHRAIRAAADQCRRVTVVVMAATVESIPLADRVAWLNAEHADAANVVVTGVRCDAPVDVDNPRVWAAQVAAMRAALVAVSDDVVDAVYCGEGYGVELARRFGAEHVPLRREPPDASSTAVRRDLAAAWDLLADPTRAGLVTRAVFVGAESTGTTTVSRAVAASYRGRGGVWQRTQWVPEYGREYTEVKWSEHRAAAAAAGRPPPTLEEIRWDADDFDAVAAEQNRRERAAAGTGSPLLVCDTDAFATSIWERRYLGTAARTAPPWAQSATRSQSVYLLTDHDDVEWSDDGLREGDLEIRACMTRWFADALTAAGHSWVLLTGSVEDRVALAVQTIDPLLVHGATFTPPLHGPGFPQRS